VFFGSAPAPVDDTPKTFGVLATNAEALGWFMRLQTQWRVGMNGPYGLDYGVFIMMAKDEEVKRGDRVWILEDLRLLEREYLAAFRLKQARASGAT
jgi:hypothetical protein